MQGTIYRCPECKSADVEILEWRNANTGVVNSGGPENYHCNACDENMKGLLTTEGGVPDEILEA